jgi:hypothetical protein
MGLIGSVGLQGGWRVDGLLHRADLSGTLQLTGHSRRQIQARQYHSRVTSGLYMTDLGVWTQYDYCICHDIHLAWDGSSCFAKGLVVPL